MQFFDTWIEKGIVARLNVCNSGCQLFMYILSRYYASPILTFLQRKMWPMESWLSGQGGNFDDQEKHFGNQKNVAAAIFTNHIYGRSICVRPMHGFF